MGYRLLEADAGDVGGGDDVGEVEAFFGEGDGGVLDAVGGGEFHQEFEEFSEVLDVVVIELWHSFLHYTQVLVVYYNIGGANPRKRCYCGFIEGGNDIISGYISAPFFH
ncbi:MAG: hypothetical protein K2H44_00465 [Muribaculaceae bacterium]|nr:hypothetical protein [Muribaculaceae bacterium]